MMEGFWFHIKIVLIVLVPHCYFSLKPVFVESNTHTHHPPLETFEPHHFNVLKPSALICSPQSPSTLWTASRTVAFWTSRLAEWPALTSASWWNVWASEYIHYFIINFILMLMLNECSVYISVLDCCWVKSKIVSPARQLFLSVIACRIGFKTLYLHFSPIKINHYNTEIDAFQ